MMKLLATTATLAAVFLLTLGSAFACHSPETPLDDDNFFAGIQNPMTLSLYNAPDLGESDTISLFALSAFEAGTTFGLEYHLDWSDSWYAFDQEMGSLFGNMISLAPLYSPPGTLDIGLRLTDGSGTVISQSAEVTFHALQSEVDGYEWFNWVSFDWLDDAGQPIDVSTMLTASLPWEAGDMVGRPVPISSTGLLLGFGLLVLVGRRSKRR
jgi:hypothetical protein